MLAQVVAALLQHLMRMLGAAGPAGVQRQRVEQRLATRQQHLAQRTPLRGIQRGSGGNGGRGKRGHGVGSPGQRRGTPASRPSSHRRGAAGLIPLKTDDLADDGTVIADITLDTLRAIRAA